MAGAGGGGEAGVMKYADEYRDERLVGALLARMREGAARLPRAVRIMEICGGHTVVLCRAGVHAVLPEEVQVVSGPGCPVCVTPRGTVDQAIWLAEQPGVVVFTFGDMLRVPGERGTLGAYAGREGKVRLMYSALQVVEYAEAHRGETCVLLGIGFETTAPGIAAAVLRAAERGVKNLFVLAAGKRTVAAMRALLEDQEVALDGFIAPGHVTTVIGARSYEFISAEFGKPCVVAGFEVCDVVDALGRVVEQLVAGAARVEIEYTRSATWEGNQKAQAVIARVFEPCEAEWRGLGRIPASGYKLRGEFEDFDAVGRLGVPGMSSADPAGCRCGEVLRGVCAPPDCALFGQGCTPEHPVGPCMVASEGSCAAYYLYGVRARARGEQKRI
ncbi:MAG: hydrogenase formation protein HypD [bacterium]|nr:hydrogenase formation protein HypD [bacterium]